MIIKGGSRANSGFYAAHLSRVDTNESVRVVEARGLVAGDIKGAFQEMAGVASGTRCKNFFYVASLNPREDETLTPEQWAAAADILEAKLGLDGQPRFIVEHFKEGRTHQHVVWSRINLDTMTAISDSLTYARHEQASREIEQIFGLLPVESVLVKDRDNPRPERRPADWESFRAETTRLDPHRMKAEITALYREADSGRAFAAALAENGFILARGDRRDFVLVDRFGDDHSLARRISGVKAAQLRERMADIDRAALPSVAEAREQAQAASDAGGDPDRQEAPTGTPADWVEALRGTPADWIEAPRGTPPDWIEAPQGTPPDWREAASAQLGEPAPQGTGRDWRPAQSGQGSDLRTAYTAWETLAGRVRSYWQRLSEFLQGGGASASTEPQTQDAGSLAAPSWVQRVIESRAVQVGRRLLHGWKHHDGIETIQGLKDAAAIVEDILARGPQQAAAQGAPDAQTAKPDDSAAPPMPATDIAAAYRAALKRTPQRDRPASSLPEPDSPDQNRPSRDVPDID